jgi:hypothetical protein
MESKMGFLNRHDAKRCHLHKPPCQEFYDILLGVIIPKAPEIAHGPHYPH